MLLNQIIFLASSFIAAAGLIYVIYARADESINSKIFLLTLFLVIAYLISHTIHFVFMPTYDVTLLDRSCHSLLLLIMVSITFFTIYYPRKIFKTKLAEFLVIVPLVLLLVMLWKGWLIRESYAHDHGFYPYFTNLYPLYLIWYLILILLNYFWIISKYRSTENKLHKKQLILYLFGLVITNTATYIFGLLLPWILGFYYLVEISPLAFMVGFIFFTSIAVGKYNMFPVAKEKVSSFSLNRKIFFVALVIVPIIILLIQIPIGRVLFGINPGKEQIRFFFYSVLVGITVSITLSFVFSRIIAQPISLLIEKVNEIERGNFNVKTNIRSNDEIGELSRAFDSMAETLSNSNSELKRKEERISILLNAFEKSLAAIAIVDEDLNIIEANERFYEICGFKRDTELNGKSILEIQFSGSKKILNEIVNSVKQKKIYLSEIQIIVQDGSQKDLLISVSEIGETRRGYLFVEIDISDRKKLEAEIIRAEKFASLGKMAAILAHEIKTPLTSIKMNADILRKSLILSDDEKESFVIIDKEITRLTNLVKEVLQFSKELTISKSETDIHSLCEDVIQQILPKLSDKKTLILNHTANTWLNVDPDKFKQVLINLAQNALEAMDENGRLEFYSTIENDFFCLYVKDNGKGIKEGDKIYDPFYTTKASGTGLGLSISKKIIELHGGDLILKKSEPGETIFEIKIPYQK
ncbi:ATP-binding protein [Melioribacter sp. OK-6-Me]|uniref:sensor histidine kinase n=1 Tax=unclassified Melioribacter TaxID=2627329 RepID=UPI003F5CF8BB